MSGERQDARDVVTEREPAEELFDFGPDVGRPAQGPRAVVPPWMDPADAPEALPYDADSETARGIRPIPGQGAGPEPAGSPGPGATPAAAAGRELDHTPSPLVVPDYVRPVPAPRRRRKPVPVEEAVIAAPDVVDGTDPQGSAGSSPTEAAGGGAAGSAMAQPAAAPPDGPAGAEVDSAAAAVPNPRRTRFLRWAQIAFVLVLGCGIGVYATGRLNVLDGRSLANAPTADAGAWVLNNVAESGSVLAPDLMGTMLLENGQDSGLLAVYAPGAEDVALGRDCCDYLILAGTPGQEVGADLPTSVRALFDRSRPTAMFRTEGGWAQVRQVLPGTPAQVAADIAAEREALAATGRQLIASARVDLAKPARTQLLAGNVDPRVLLAVVAVALEHDVRIRDFPAVPGEEAEGILRRSVAFDRVNGQKIGKNGKQAEPIRDVLARQVGFNRPAGAEVRMLGEVRVLEARFDAPSPFGLLTLTDENGDRAN